VTTGRRSVCHIVFGETSAATNIHHSATSRQEASRHLQERLETRAAEFRASAPTISIMIMIVLRLLYLRPFSEPQLLYIVDLSYVESILSNSATGSSFFLFRNLVQVQ
jgi:hypothetical protein